jgi:glutamate carboxypeptidase
MWGKVLSMVDVLYPKYKRLLQDIVMMESYTTNKEAVDAVCSFIDAFARKERYLTQVKLFEKAGNGLLISTGTDTDLPSILCVGHMDTVFPTGTWKNLWQEDDGIVHGPGVVDMKGGIATALLAMEALLQGGYRERNLKLVLIPDEEYSEIFSGQEGKDFIRDSAIGCAAAFTMEGNLQNDVTVGRKGSIRCIVNVKGRAAHAGINYREGISAIKEAAQKILSIESASDPDNITYNCGLIKGGTAQNTVPETCEFTLYNRYWEPKQRDEIIHHIESIFNQSFIPNTTCTYEIVGERPPMKASAKNYALFEQIRKASLKCGFGDKKSGVQAGGSDAAYTSMAGIPSVCSMGITGGKPHTLEEYAYLDSLNSQAKLLCTTILDLPADFYNA